MAQTLRDDLKSEREASPYPFYGIEIDEATDCADKSVIIVFIRFVTSAGQLHTAFLGVKELEQTDAHSLFDATKAILEEHNLPLAQMFGLASGVATQ